LPKMQRRGVARCSRFRKYCLTLATLALVVAVSVTRRWCYNITNFVAAPKPVPPPQKDKKPPAGQPEGSAPWFSLSPAGLRGQLQ
ncbi:unnamed protein product, partial [Polarella glacialis]